MSRYPQEIRQRLLGTPEQNAIALVGEPPRRWSTIVIEDYDPAWPERFEAAASVVTAALGDLVVSIEHVGSTAVPGLAAKPIVDIDLTIDDTADETRFVPALATSGYRLLLREPWWYGHRMLISAEEDVHLHVWPTGAPEAVRHLLFRDWLRTHPSDRELYESAKRRIAVETASRPGDYSLTKSDVIDEIFARIFAS